jgi:hypothetical protein
MVVNLVKQLLSQSNDIHPDIESLYDEYICTGKRPDRARFTQLLRSFSAKYSIYAIFDAIDECSDANQEDLLLLFAELQTAGIRRLISSRPHLQHIQEQLGDVRTFEIRADESDLRRYVTFRLNKEKQINIKLKDKCLELIKGVQGM